MVMVRALHCRVHDTGERAGGRGGSERDRGEQCGELDVEATGHRGLLAVVVGTGLVWLEAADAPVDGEMRFGQRPRHGSDRDEQGDELLFEEGHGAGLSISCSGLHAGACAPSLAWL